MGLKPQRMTIAVGTTLDLEHILDCEHHATKRPAVSALQGDVVFPHKCVKRIIGRCLTDTQFFIVQQLIVFHDFYSIL